MNCIFCLNFVAFLKLKLLFYYLIHKKMKKFVLSLAVLAGLSFVACNNAETKAEAAEDAANDAVEAVVEEVAEVNDSTAEVVEEVVAEGDSVKA